MSKPLIPPDYSQCQAEKPNGHSFMTLGGVPGLERCKNKPQWVIHETVPDKNGQCGSMSLCDACLEVFRKQVGMDGYRLEPAIKPRTVAEMLEEMEKAADILHSDLGHPVSGTLLRDARALLERYEKARFFLVNVMQKSRVDEPTTDPFMQYKLRVETLEEAIAKFLEGTKV